MNLVKDNIPCIKIKCIAFEKATSLFPNRNVFNCFPGDEANARAFDAGQHTIDVNSSDRAMWLVYPQG